MIGCWAVCVVTCPVAPTLISATEPSTPAVQPELARTDAVQRREPTTQHEIQPAKVGRLLDGDDLGRLLDHAQQTGITSRIGADAAKLVLAQGPAAPTALDAEHGVRHDLRQTGAAFTVALQQMKGDPLRRFGTDTRQTAQGIDQLIQQ